MPIFENASYVYIYGGTFTDIQGEHHIQGDPETIKLMRDILEDEERQKVLAWVSPVDVAAKHSDVARVRQSGTGKWLLNSERFRGWESGTREALWCPGIPGAGKTILASLVIDHLCALRRRQPLGAVAVAWFYYNYKEELTQTCDALYLSLIQQLAAFSERLYTDLKSAYRKKARISRPTGRQLIGDIRTLTSEFTKVYIVIDALDECATSSRDIVVDILSAFQTSGANILITSRDNISENIVNSGLTGLKRVDIRGDVDDITKYINARLDEHKRLARIIGRQPFLRGEIVRVILGACDGMFLMAKFHVDSLGKHLNVGQVCDALAHLPTTFPGIYEETIERIENSDHADQALRALSFLIHARRPLYIAELQHFLAITPGDPEFRKDYITDGDILVAICAGLLVVDEKRSIARLVHLTAQEYLDKVRASKFPNGDLQIGDVCLTYLSFNVFKEPFDESRYWDIMSSYPLLAYIACHWHEHVPNHDQDAHARLMRFLANDVLISIETIIRAFVRRSQQGFIM